MKQKVKRFFELENYTIDFRIFLLLLMPIMVFFSFYPMINLGQNHGMHLEVSLLEIYLVLFVLANLKPIWQNRQNIIKNKAVWLIFAFCTLNTLSLLWTPNFVKGLLISGIIWLLFACFLAFLSYKNLKKLLPALFRVLILSSCLMAIFALFQMLAEIVGLPQSVSLLCDGCLANQFGFARITGFAIEPQFFGSLLLAPILLLLHKCINQPCSLELNRCLTLLLIVMFLTLSRGAIYALVIGFIVLAIIHHKKLKQVALSCLVMFGAFIMSLVIQGLSTELNPRINDNFSTATSRAIHQLSLGLIDIRPSPPSSSEKTVEEEHTQELLDEDRPIQDGYVEESTGIRTMLSQLSLEAWTKTPANIIFGTGAGSTGYVLHHYFPDQIGDTEIAQNQYVETLLENGLIGLGLFVTLIVLLFRATRQHKFLWAVFAAFLVQWLFFSGYPNALHVYLFCLLCIALAPLLTRERGYARVKAENQHEKQKKTKQN
jgi:ABC-type multidrug transport system fused ATPase/permease subunit